MIQFPRWAILGGLLCAAAPAVLSASDPAQEVAALIEQLPEVDSLQTVYAGTFSFSEFPPLDEAPLQEYPLATGSPAEAAFRAMIRLVELGPTALPGLLKHLDDQRETQTTVTEEYATSLGPSAYLDFRPGDSRDEAVIAKENLPRSNPGPGFDEAITGYTLTVGDFSFALIGMITNRSYYVIVDEFGAQLNSPTRAEKLVHAVRGKWGKAPERMDLYLQLMHDLEHGAARYANAAARRLLYYFPGQCENLVVNHFVKLLKAHEPGSDELANFIEAIAWSTSAQISSLLRRFLLTAEDANQIAAASVVYGKSTDPRGHAQLVQLADRLKLRRDPSHVKASRVVLGVNLMNYPARREETVRRFLEGAGAYAQTSALLVCEGVAGAPVAALAPLLENEGPSTGDQYLVKGSGAADVEYLPYRIRDRAYETICRLLGDKESRASGSPAEMDRRIASLRKRLQGKPENWKFSASELAARQREREQES